MAFRLKETLFSFFRPLFKGALLACDQDGGHNNDDEEEDSEISYSIVIQCESWMLDYLWCKW